MKESESKRTTLSSQLVTLSVLGIIIALLLAMGSTLWLNLSNNHELLDQNMKDVASVLSKNEMVRDLLTSKQNAPSVNILLQDLTREITNLDVVALTDSNGKILVASSCRNGIPENFSCFTKELEKDPIFRVNEEQSRYRRSARAKVYSDQGELVGYVVVGVYMRSVYHMMGWTILQYVVIASVTVTIGGCLAHRLAEHIKNELEGYEPKVFHNMMVQRGQIWDALEEGVMAIDSDENLIYVNAAARNMLCLPDEEVSGRPLHEVYPASTLDQVLHSGKPEYNVPLKSLLHAKVIADRMPVLKDGKIVGAVAIFRNRTEMTRMAEDLTGVRHVVEALRANTHEFMNKLHVILGLLQLKEYDEAEQYVLDLTKVRTQSMGGITERIQESAVAALLIGKLSSAQEQQVVFKLNSSSYFPKGSRCLPVDAMISLLGNLIENAFDSFRYVPPGAVREVEVYVREEEKKGLVLCVEDTGRGMSEKVQQRIFERGFSTKGKDRGTGLALVQSIVQAYSGEIRVESVPGMGSTFTITIPPQEDK